MDVQIHQVARSPSRLLSFLGLTEEHLACGREAAGRVHRTHSGTSLRTSRRWAPAQLPGIAERRQYALAALSDAVPLQALTVFSSAARPSV
ncbi:hypothetical protein SHIRM173S_13070 [Streptomyces hirsutus]